jgi:segregation and condensation protein B
VQALETLAVIAYKQPITAAEIAEVRGVNTAGVLGTLIDRKLIKIVGRKQVVGRPIMYATTREFLNRFGLRDLDDLPKIDDIADALGFEPPALDQGLSLPFDDAGASRADVRGTAGRDAAGGAPLAEPDFDDPGADDDGAGA